MTRAKPAENNQLNNSTENTQAEPVEGTTITPKTLGSLINLIQKKGRVDHEAREVSVILRQMIYGLKTLYEMYQAAEKVKAETREAGRYPVRAVMFVSVGVTKFSGLEEILEGVNQIFATACREDIVLPFVKLFDDERKGGSPRLENKLNCLNFPVKLCFRPNPEAKSKGRGKKRSGPGRDQDQTPKSE